MKRTAGFPAGGLAAAWAGFLAGGGLLYALLPGTWSPWVFLSFWVAILLLALVTFRHLQRTVRHSYRLTRQMELSGDLFWAVDDQFCLTALSGAVEPVLGREVREVAHIPLTRLLSREKATAFELNAKQGKPFAMEAEIMRPDGGGVAVDIRGEPLPAGCGEGVYGIIRDLREKRRQEGRLREMKQRLERSEKLKNLGLLAGSVAHDLNNILSGIATYPEVLLMDPSLAPKARQGIEMIKDSGRKASSVVSDLLTISRGARADRQVLNVNTVVQRYLMAAEFEKIEETYPHVEIEINLEPELLNMKGSYIHIEKAVMNLMLNAVEETAGRPGGLVRLSTANHYADEASEDTLAPGEYVMLRVEDNGAGIPRKYQDKIFDPFFTQKEMGKSGTGLGLTVVQNTVRDHRGDIRVVSDGNGTRFDLFFPGVREEMPKARETDSLEEIKGSGQTILIVDDLASQRKIGSTILTNLGYTVFTVADGLEALAFVKDRAVDLLVLDMIMAPSISGLETYRRIKAERPDQRAIIASGHPESEDVLKTLELGAGSFVKKPYTIMDMGIAVKEELER